MSEHVFDNSKELKNTIELFYIDFHCKLFPYLMCELLYYEFICLLYGIGTCLLDFYISTIKKFKVHFHGHTYGTLTSEKELCFIYYFLVNFYKILQIGKNF